MCYAAIAKTISFLLCIVFRPARWAAWFNVRIPSFDRVTGSSGSIFFLKSKRRCFSKKKKKSTGCNQVFDRVLPGQPGTSGFFFPYFFFNPARFQPRIGRSRVNPPGRAEFQKYASMLLISWWNFDILVSNHLLSAVCFCILKIFEKNYFFIYFCIFISFWCTDVKNNFLKVKNIILMCFQIKNTLKNNNY